MKKSIAILMALTLGSVASAGTVIWQCEDIMNGATYLDGGKAYLFVGDSVSGVADAVKGGTFNYGDAIAETTTDDEGYFKVQGIGSYQEEDVSLYMLVFDKGTVAASSKFKVSDTITKTFGKSGNQTYKFGDSVSSASWQNIPEPTTVALLALGLAAVGLKRKIA